MLPRGTAWSAAALLGAWLVSACASGPRPREDGSALVRLKPDHAEPDVIQAVHRVQAGETLYHLARRYGITVEELAQANGIPAEAPLTVGQELVIPGTPPEGRPGAGEGVGAGRQARSEGVSGLAASEGVAARGGASTRGVLGWPLRGVLYARFGMKGKEPHDGIDLAAPAGTPVKTAAPGKVLYAGEQQGYGLIVIVEHAGGLVTIYAHNRDLRVRAGQGVRASQVIATVGESGRTSGPHLHFEVRKDGVPVDPLRYLGAPPVS